MKFLLYLLFLFVVIILAGCDDQTQGVVKPIMKDIMTEEMPKPEMPTDSRYITLNRRYNDAGQIVEGETIDVSQMRITQIPESIFVIGTHIITGEVVLIYQGLTPASTTRVLNLINGTTDDINISEIGFTPDTTSADREWMEEKFFTAINFADQHDGTKNNEGWVNADKIISDINSSVIYQDVNLGNAKLKYEFTSEWSIGQDFVDIRISQVLWSLNSKSASGTTIYGFELQSIDGVRFIRFNPYKTGSGDSRRILVDYGLHHRGFVIDADAINIEHSPNSIFVIGTYIADGKRIVLFQGTTPGSAQHAFNLLRSATGDINIVSSVTEGGDYYKGNWYNGEQLADAIWITENFGNAVVATDPLDGKNDGWAIAEQATEHLVSRVKFQELGFESANLLYEVKLPREPVNLNPLSIEYAMNIVVDEETKGFQNWGREIGGIGLPGFETKVEHDAIYIRKVND